MVPNCAKGAIHTMDPRSKTLMGTQTWAPGFVNMARGICLPLLPPNPISQPSQDTAAAMLPLSGESQMFTVRAASGFPSVQLSLGEKGREESKTSIALLSLG